jgi:hypothetical protein
LAWANNKPGAPNTAVAAAPALTKLRREMSWEVLTVELPFKNKDDNKKTNAQPMSWGDPEGNLWLAMRMTYTLKANKKVVAPMTAISHTVSPEWVTKSTVCRVKAVMAM